MRKKSEMKLGRVWRIRVRILILMCWAGRVVTRQKKGNPLLARNLKKK